MDELPAEMLALIAESLPLRGLIRGLALTCRTLGAAAQHEVRHERQECDAVRDLLQGRPCRGRICPAAWGLSEARPYAALAARVLPLLLVTTYSLPDLMPREVSAVAELDGRIVAECALRSGTPRVAARSDALPSVHRGVRVLAAATRDDVPLPDAEPLALLRPGSRVRVRCGGGDVRDYVFLPTTGLVGLYLRGATGVRGSRCILSVRWRAIHLDHPQRSAIPLTARCDMIVELTGGGGDGGEGASVFDQAMHSYAESDVGIDDWFDPPDAHGRRRAIGAMLARGLPVTSLVLH